MQKCLPYRLFEHSLQTISGSGFARDHVERNLNLFAKPHCAPCDAGNRDTVNRLQQQELAIRTKAVNTKSDLSSELVAGGHSMQREIPAKPHLVQSLVLLFCRDFRALKYQFGIMFDIQNFFKHHPVNLAPVGLAHFIENLQRRKLDLDTQTRCPQRFWYELRLSAPVPNRDLRPMRYTREQACRESLHGKLAWARINFIADTFPCC